MLSEAICLFSACKSAYGEIDTTILHGDFSFNNASMQIRILSPNIPLPKGLPVVLHDTHLQCQTSQTAMIQYSDLSLHCQVKFRKLYVEIILTACLRCNHAARLASPGKSVQ